MSENHDSSPIPGDIVRRWHGHLERAERALGRLDADLLRSDAEPDVVRAALEDLLAASREIETVERLMSQRLLASGGAPAPDAPQHVPPTGDRGVVQVRRALVGASAH